MRNMVTITMTVFVRKSSYRRRGLFIERSDAQILGISQNPSRPRITIVLKSHSGFQFSEVKEPKLIKSKLSK